MAAWSIVSRLTRSLQPRSTLSGRDLQLHLDTASIYTAIEATHSKLLPNPTPEQQHVADLLGIPPLPPFELQAAAVTNHLTSSTLHCLRALASALRSGSVERHLRSKLGFSNRVAESSVPDAGRGVFVDGIAAKGALISLYPGVSYLPSQLRHTSLKSQNETDNSAAIDADYCISRYDGVVIDGAAPVELDVVGMLPEDGTADVDQLIHPFALGHLVNHPPQGIQPNCLQFMLDIDLGPLPQDLQALVPVENWGPISGILERIENEAFRQRVPASAAFVRNMSDFRRIRRTVALVATREIEDEEVFMNYRLNPFATGLPKWYHDCDPDTSARRWKEKGVFY